jgi:hypothetical protein
MTIIIDCPYEPPHTHEYPDDWEFGGASGLDPRVDRRWHPTTYEYIDADLKRSHVTQVPLCDDEALDYFTFVANLGPSFNPVWVWAVTPEGVRTLPFTYDKATDTVYPKGDE